MNTQFIVVPWLLQLMPLHTPSLVPTHEPFSLLPLLLEVLLQLSFLKAHFSALAHWHDKRVT